MDQQGFTFTALAAFVIMFAALLAGGANSGALAGYLGAALMGLALIKAVSMHPTALAPLLAAHWLSLAASLGFLTLAAISATPAISNVAHTWPATLAPTSLSPYRTVEGIAAFTAPMAAFAIGVFVGADLGARAWCARMLLLFSIVYAGWALIGYAPSEAIRLSAHLGSANTAACIFGMLAAFALAHLARAVRLGQIARGSGLANIISNVIRASPLALAALVLTGICLVLTLSRGGILAAALSLVVLALFLIAGASSRRALIWLLAPSAIAAGGAAAFVVLQRSTLAVANGASDAVSLEGRRTLIDVFWRAFLERPAFGHGLNTYHELSALNATPSTWEALRTSGSVHNIYLQALAETGVVGLTLLALTLCAPLLRGARAALHGSEWSAAVLAMTTVCLLQGLADFGLQTPAIAAILAFALGAFVKTSPGRRSSVRGGAG